MKKLFYILLLAAALISCQGEEIEQGSLDIPQRFVGEYVGNAAHYTVKIERHKLSVITEEQVFVRTEGTTTIDNGTTHFEASLKDGERLVLLFREGCCIGITLC